MYPSSCTTRASLGLTTSSSSSYVMLGQNDGIVTGSLSSIGALQLAQQNSDSVLLHTSPEVPPLTAAAAATSAAQHKPNTYSGGARTEALFLLPHNHSHGINTNVEDTATILGSSASSHKATGDAPPPPPARTTHSDHLNKNYTNNTKTNNNYVAAAAAAAVSPPLNHYHYHQTTELSVLRDLLTTSGAVDAISLLLSVQFCLDYIAASGDEHHIREVRKGMQQRQRMRCDDDNNDNETGETNRRREINNTTRLKNEFMRAVACVLSVVFSVQEMSQRERRKEREERSFVSVSSFPMLLFASRVVGECVAISEEAACKINELLVFSAKKREKQRQKRQRGGLTREEGDNNDNNNEFEDEDYENDDNDNDDSASVVFPSIFAAQSSKMSWHLAQLISESLVPLVRSTIANDQPSGATNKAHHQQQRHGGASSFSSTSSAPSSLRSWRTSRFYSEAEPPRVPLSFLSLVSQSPTAVTATSSSALTIPIQSPSSSTGHQYSSNSNSAPSSAPAPPSAATLSILDDFIVLCCSDRPMVERQIASHALKRFIEPFVAVHLTSICESEGAAAFFDIITTSSDSGVPSILLTSAAEEKANRRGGVATTDDDDDNDNDNVREVTNNNNNTNNTANNNISVDGNAPSSLAQALHTMIATCWGGEFYFNDDSMFDSCVVEGTCSLRGEATTGIEGTGSDNNIVFGGVFYPLLTEIYSNSSSSVSPPILSSAAVANNTAAAAANAPHNNNNNNNTNNIVHQNNKHSNNYTYCARSVAVEALSRQLASLLLTMLLESSGPELDAGGEKGGEERKQLSCGTGGMMSRRFHRHCSPTPLTALISLSRMLIMNEVSPRGRDENTQHSKRVKEDDNLAVNSTTNSVMSVVTAAPAFVALLLDATTTSFDMFLTTSALPSTLHPSSFSPTIREDDGERGLNSDSGSGWVPPWEDLNFVSCGCDAIDCVIGGNGNSDSECSGWRQSGVADSCTSDVFGGRGFKRGQLTEIYGEAGSGKTQIGLHTIVYNASLVVRTTKRDSGGAMELNKKKANDAIENEEQASGTTATAAEGVVKRHGAIYLVSEDVPQRRIRQFAEYFSRDRDGVWTRSEAAIRETLDAVFIRKVPDLEALIDVLDPSSLDSFVRERNVNVIVVDSIAACVQGTRNNNSSPLGNDDGYTVGGRRGRRTREDCGDDDGGYGQGDEEYGVGKKHRQWQQQGSKGNGRSPSSNFFASSQPSRSLLLERAGAALISAAARLNIAVVTINQVRADTNSGDSNNNDGTMMAEGDRRSSALLPALGWRWSAIVKNRFHLSRDTRVPVCVVPLAHSTSFSYAHTKGGSYCSEGDTRGAERQIFAVRKHGSAQTLNSTVPSTTALPSSQPLRSLMCVYSTHRPSGSEGCFAIAPECLVGVGREDLV